MINFCFFRFRNTFSFLSFMILFLLQGCSKNNEFSAGGAIAIKIKSVSASFANADIGVGKHASIGKLSEDIYNDGIQRNTVSLNNDYILVSELVPDAISSANNGNSIVKKASVDVTRNLADNVVYKLLVYDASGALVEERDYAVGPESINNAELTLLKGLSYTFIAVSLNSAILPVISNKTSLSAATVEISSSPTADLMHYTLTKTLNTDDESNLEINFSHAFSKITVEIDASDTEYNISAVSSVFSARYLTNSLKLSTMILTQSGSTSSNTVTFTGLNQQVVTSNPIIVSAQGVATNTYRISSLTINSIIGSNINVFENMTILSGVSYTLKMKVTPDDAIIDNNNVRINGQVWARFNLGASGMTAGTSADLNPGNGSLFGDYYRWGDKYPSIIVSYNSLTEATTKVVDPDYGYKYEGNSYLNNSPNFASGQLGWDAMDGSQPTKGIRDPCPDGFRLPSVADFNKLLLGVNPEWSATASYVDNGNNYGAIVILRSKRKHSVKLTIPMQGVSLGLSVANVPDIYGQAFFNGLQTRDYPTGGGFGVTMAKSHYTGYYLKMEVSDELEHASSKPYSVRCRAIN